MRPISRVSTGWLAAHYEAAGILKKAIPYYRTAASVAKQLPKALGMALWALRPKTVDKTLHAA